MKLISFCSILVILSVASIGVATAGISHRSISGQGNRLSGRIYQTAGDSIGFRTFKPDSIVLSRDERGRSGKYVARKPVRVFFSVMFRNTVLNADGMHVSFTAPIDTSYPLTFNRPVVLTPADPHFANWDLVFPTPLDGGDTLIITGYAKGAKPVTIKKYFWRSQGISYKATTFNFTFTDDTPRYSMPNRINALYEAFRLNGFSPTGLTVGVGHYLDSARYFGWLQSENYLDVLKSLGDRSGFQTGWPRGFDYFTSFPAKAIVRRQKSIPPSRQNNRLLGGMIALRINIVASELGITPPGFGELIYDDSTDNPLNGLMVKEIADLADTMMTGWYDETTGLRTFPPSPEFVNLSATVESLNTAFEGPLDTLKFFDTLRYTPARLLADVPYLFPNPRAVPARITPVVRRTEEYLPDRFSLLQNYPNPFNPTTTVEFNLPSKAVVSLAIYNVLGQQIQTIYDHALLEDGLYEAEVNGVDLPSGVYFYRLIADEVSGPDGAQGRHLTAVKKMMLMK